MNNPIQITLGTPIKFDSEHGPQQGNVVGIRPEYLLVEVAGTLSGCVWKVERNDKASIELAAA